MKPIFRFPLCVVFAALLTANIASAANIVQDVTQTAGQDWTLGTSWNPDGAPAAGNDYFTAPTLDLYTPTGTATFAGNSLTVVAGSTLYAQQAASTTITVADLTLAGGTLSAGVQVLASQYQFLQGKLTVTADSQIDLSGSDARRLQYVGGTLSGSGALTLNGPATANYNNILFLNGTNGSTHSGAINVINSRLVTSGSNTVGDTSLITLTDAQLDLRGNEVFGGLSGNSGSGVVFDNTSHIIGLNPQSNAGYAGTIGQFSQLKVNAAPGISQTLTSPTLKIATLDANAGTLNLNNVAATVSGNALVGQFGAGTVTQAGTSAVTVGGELRIGYGAGGVGEYIASGGTLNVLSQQTETGRGGTGTLTVSGASVTTRSTFIGVEEGGFGTLNVSSGTFKTNSSGDSVYIGYRGNGTLNQTGGTITIPGDLRISEGNTNKFSIGTVNIDGGSLSANRLVNARLINATSNFYMNGGNLTIASTTWIAFSGTGSYTQSGGTANVGAVIVAQDPSATGTVSLDGGIFTAPTVSSGNGAAAMTIDGATVTVNGTTTFDAPSGSSAVLNIKNGALNINAGTSLYIATLGTATLNHTGGTTTLSGDLRVGEDTGATLPVGTVNFDGGTLNAARLVGARNSGGTNDFNMNGGTLAIAGDGWVAYSGNGSYTQTGGVASFGRFLVTNDASGVGSVDLNGGTLTVGAAGFVKGNGSATVTMNGGTLRAGANAASAPDITLAAPDGGTFDSNGNTFTINGALSGSGPVSKAGSGTVRFAGNNSFTGPVDVQAGILAMANAGALGNSNSVHIAGGATFDVTAVAGYSPSGTAFSGNGTLAFSGPISFSGATLAPGDSPGQLDLAGGNVNGIGTYNWQLFDAGSTPGTGWDLINITAGDYNIPAGAPFDVINVTGLSALPNVAGLPAGLDISVVGNTTGPFTILQTSGTINGNLADIQLNFGNLGAYGTFTLSIAGGNQLQLLFTSTVPEPGTWVMLVALFALAGMFMRRRLIG